MNADPSDRTTAFQAHRPRLLRIAYRMLGSRADAEDVLQDAWLRWQGAAADRVRTPEAWLVTAVTRLCVDRLRAVRSEREAYVGPWLPEPWLGGEEALAPPADARAELASDLSIALLVLLERLTPDERAAFLLHDVFDGDHAEIAAVLGKSEAATRQLVHRARQQVRRDKPRFEAGGDAQRQLLERFVEALRSDDHAALLALFADRARWVSDGGGKAKAARKAVLGRALVARFARGIWQRYLQGMRLQPTTINGEPGLLMVETGDGGRVIGTLSIEADARGDIATVYTVLNPDKLTAFQPPARTDEP